MATPSRRKKLAHHSLAKVPKTYRLTPAKLYAAQRILGTATATEAIETALDMVVFRRELSDGTRAMLGIHLDLLSPCFPSPLEPAADRPR
jgi:hypothetical protein